MREITTIIAFLDIVMAILAFNFAIKAGREGGKSKTGAFGIALMGLLYAISAVLLFTTGRRLW